MTIFVVGPSRAGKTTLINKVLKECSREFSEVRLLDLDAEENRSVELIRTGGGDPGGWEERWSRNIESIRREEDRGGDLIVDVGAGSLETPAGRGFFIDRRNTTIAVVAPWQVVHSRYEDRSAQEFKQTEYSANREEVYRSAVFKVSSNGGIDQSARKFRQAMRKVLNKAKT